MTILFLMKSFLRLAFMIKYIINASKLIINQKLFVISFKLSHFIANNLTNIALLCKTMYQCGTLIITSKPRKILISF